MSLEKYKKKRELDKTPEPNGSEKEGTSLNFVIQKHKARALHYDFRLEAGGVLKSWAVPKGIPNDPNDKRLAKMVEDHPVDYQNFEGIIPKGNYGAGTVMIWDKGVYGAESRNDPKEIEAYILRGIEKGHFSFILNGKKLKGVFTLARLKTLEDWILIKKEDEFSGQKVDDEKSAETGRTLEEITLDSGKTRSFWASSTEEIDLSGIPEGKMQRSVKPMMATLVDKPFSDPEWIYEIKWDGYRAIAEIKNKKVNLYSRNLNSFNKLFPQITEALRSFENDVVLDGEIVSLDRNGKPSFQNLQNYQNTGKGNLVYYLFDILYLNGHDLTALPLIKRKEILNKVLPELPNIKISEYIEETGEDFFNVAKEQGLEGIMAKNKSSKYQIGIRSKDWLKIKNKLRQEFIIVGYTEPAGSRQHFGSLLLAVNEKGKLKFAGNVGTGFSEVSLNDLKAKLDALKIDEPSVANISKLKNITWVKPELIAEVTFQEWTKEGQVRQAVFLGLREDVEKEAVKEEHPKKEEVVLKEENEETLKFDDKTFTVRNLNKIFFPEDGISKRDLLNYYSAISKYVIPYLYDRPETLKRYPNGIYEPKFYHKDIGDITPPWLKTYRDYAEKEDKHIDYMLVNDLPSLLWMVNMAAIEMHPWSSRVETPNNPDFIVIDLDPLEIDFKYVAETALAVKEVLDELKIKGYPKTSGATGMHIYIPLAAKYDFETARQFAEIIASLVHKKKPKITSIERMQAKRKGKVYIDFLQNIKGQTVAAPYSVRPLPGAPVSTPLKWEEITENLNPQKFTIFTVPERVKKVGDLFEGVLGEGVDIEKVLREL